MANSQTVAETVRHWCSKAANLSFHMFPVPEDPFSHASNPLSLPLQCPVLIPFRPDKIQSHNVRLYVFELTYRENFFNHGVFYYNFFALLLVKVGVRLTRNTDLNTEYYII